jgi:hypothetical protein
VKLVRIVLDENVPRSLVGIFGSGHQVTTVQDLGLAGFANGAFLALLEGNYDVFVTADKNLRYQQNLAGRNWPSWSSQRIDFLRSERCRATSLRP